MCANEPHIRALNQQSADKATILLTAAGSELWSATETALATINAKTFQPTAANFETALAEIDATLAVTK